jgi:hypothetical protein
LGDQEESQLPIKEVFVINCKRCSGYEIDETLAEYFRKIFTHRAQSVGFTPEDERLLPYLSAYTRQKNERGETVELHSGNWRGCALQHNNTPEEQKLHKLLALIQNRTQIPGYSAPLDCNLDYPLIDAASLEECSDLLDDLKKRGFLKYNRQTGASYNVTILSPGRRYMEERSRQAIGEMDYEAVPEAARHDLMKAAERYRSGDLSGALAAACAAVESACARVFKEKNLGDPAKVPSFQQKVIKSLRANDAFKRLESELTGIGWDSGDARQLAQDLEASLNRAASVMQALRSKMSDAHGSKVVLKPVVFDALKWATIIASQLR